MEEDDSGLTFQEWTQDVNTSRSPDVSTSNSSELCAGFKIKKVIPPVLEEMERGGLHTRGVGLRSLEWMGPTRFVLSVVDDTEFRSRCE